MDVQSKFHMLARAGYTARGVVFLLVAGLALVSGLAGSEPDTQSALRTLFQQPLGRVWIALVGLGLSGFVVWRLAQSIANADHQASDLQGYLIRAVMFGSAVAYAALAITCYSMALLYSQGSGSSGEQGVAYWVMSQPFGRYLAGVIGVGFVIGGCVTAIKGLARRFGRHLNLDVSKNSPAVLISIYGLFARGIVFVIIGGFFIYAAFTVNPEQAGGTAEALAWVRQLPFGGTIYTIVAIGLAAFGLHNFVEARYRRIDKPETRHLRRHLPIGTTSTQRPSP